MLEKHKGLPFLGLFAAIFIAIVMGFIIGALLESFAVKDANHDIKKLVEEELKGVSADGKGIGNFAEFYFRLKASDPLIVGLNIISLDGTIIYSDEDSLIGKKFSGSEKILKVITSKEYHSIDRNLISQETLAKGSYKSLMVSFYYFDTGFIVQILYDIKLIQNSIFRITSLLWFIILLSVSTLFIALLYISKVTRVGLERAKENLESEVKKRTRELEETKNYLDKEIKARTKALQKANAELKQKAAYVKNDIIKIKKSEESIKKRNVELLKKTIELNELKGKFEDKNIDLESAVKNLNKQNTDLIIKTMTLTEMQGQLEDNNFELEGANKEILKLSEERIDFINKSAHDLRTPITPILALIPSIRNHINDKEVLNDIEVIERNANYLKRIADNLISYLRSKTGKYNYIFKENDIRKLIDEVLTTYEELFHQNNISVIKKIPHSLPLVKVDDLKMKEVVQNIVSNALKFTPKKGKLIISARKIDNFINIKFKDMGIGMAKKTLSKLFEEFFKADASRHSTGQGLGLLICKDIIERHNGTITAESKGLGKGSTISFTIPINQEVR